MSSNGKSEFALINWIKKQQGTTASDVKTSIGDDMAVIANGHNDFLVTCDMLLEGVHFDLSVVDLASVGYKAMACSLSDVAAMGATPVGAVVAVALPKSLSLDDAKLLHSGLTQASEKYKCPLVGGYTTSWDQPLAINVTMFAHHSPDKAILRSGAKAGDAIMVTGSLGGSIKGKHVNFTPRLAESQFIQAHIAIHAMCDISDGLSSDLNHLCTESNVSSLLDATSIPLSHEVKKRVKPIEGALNDGEDFELLFTCSPGDADKLMQLWPDNFKCKLTNIGQIFASDDPFINNQIISIRDNLTGKITPVTPKGYQHFL
jgi:thiamine-monophosphate kinase